MVRWTVLAVAALLSACAMPRDEPPVLKYEVGRPSDDVLRCLVPAMDAAIAGMTLEPDHAHRIEIVDIDRVWEVVQTRQGLLGLNDVYVVRVTKRSGGSLVELHAFLRYRDALSPAVSGCADEA